MEDWKTEVERLRQQKPGHILFLCVANSARSQMAEGIASSLAPGGVRISSAGSKPTSVRTEAIEALKEIGIDISKQYSKGLDAVDMKSVDAVITLCAEEVCPYFPGQVARLHWDMLDPAAASGDMNAGMNAFRQVRDELGKRLKYLFDGWEGAK